MTKSKKDKLAEAHMLYTAAKQGCKPKSRAKDGSIPTRAIVPCPDLPEEGENGVKDLCYKWLKARRIFCNKHACGRKGGVLYGIKGSGDIHGYLPDGRGFEIECKRGKGGHQRSGQRDRMALIHNTTAALYFVVRGENELAHYFKDLL